MVTTAVKQYFQFMMLLSRFFGAWQPLVPIHFHYMKESSGNILQNVSFHVPRKEIKTKFCNDMWKWRNFVWTIPLTSISPESLSSKSNSTCKNVVCLINCASFESPFHCSVCLSSFAEMFLNIPRLKQAVLTKYTADPNSWQSISMLQKDCLFMKGQSGKRRSSPANILMFQTSSDWPQVSFRSMFFWLKQMRCG